MSHPKDAQVVKVKPYPFAASLESGGAQKPVDIIFIAEVGVIVNLRAQFVKVGEYHQLVFELPTMGDVITTQVRVIKTYDKSMDKVGQKVERMAELHFQKLTDAHKARIVAFMSAIGQTK